ncbi:MAG: response regulator [Desulfocapsaceae bacterium]|nr:response regulator [Desulfocapsaceae bacterium]
MAEKILFVDDESNVLDSIARQLRKRFTLSTAISGQEALQVLKDQGPFSVVVSDMRMPGMDGVQFLETVKELYPDTVRMMLTGNADQGTAIEAVNKGQIFRFLNKPCSTAVLVPALALAQRQHRLITAERELLDKTLMGSVKVLAELLSLSNPTAFSRGYRIKNIVVELAQLLEQGHIWKYEIAALMSQIGCITLPTDILHKKNANISLTREETEMYRSHPQAGASLLAGIPRLESVAVMIALQMLRYDAYTDETSTDEEGVIGAQILKIALDYDLLLFQGKNSNDALHELSSDMGEYNPNILKLLGNVKSQDKHASIVSLRIQDISIGMIAEENILAKNGILLAPKGQEITWPVLQGLLNFSRQVGVREPVMVRIEQVDGEAGHRC